MSKQDKPPTPPEGSPLMNLAVAEEKVIAPKALVVSVANALADNEGSVVFAGLGYLFDMNYDERAFAASLVDILAEQGHPELSWKVEVRLPQMYSGSPRLALELICSRILLSAERSHWGIPQLDRRRETPRDSLPGRACETHEVLDLLTADELMTYLVARCNPGTLREVARRLLAQ